MTSRFDPCPTCGEKDKSCAVGCATPRWIPNPKQEQFLSSGAFELCTGGAKGGAKSEGLLIGSLHGIDHPRYVGLLLRREREQTKRTLLRRSKELFPALGGRWYQGGWAWEFPSGARIEINGCDNERDVERYQGMQELSYLGLDELTHFLRSQYLYLISCVRSAAGLPLSVRAATNPGSQGHDWVLARFAPWLYPRPGEPWSDPAYLGPWADDGEVLWYRTTTGDAGTETPCARDEHEPSCERCAPRAPCPVHQPRSRQFIKSFVTDNPFLAGTAYEANLHSLDPLERARFLGGNWMIRAEPGVYFDRRTIAILDAAPAPVLCRLRYWDRASTAATDKGAKRAAWTAGVRMAMLTTGLILIEHVDRGQWDPGAVDARILARANDDPQGSVIALEKDGGQAGTSQAYYDARMLAGREFVLPPPVADKTTRMKPFSAQCRAGNVALLRGPWNEPYLRELEGCPMGLWDQIDSSSGGLIQLLKLQEQLVALRRAAALRDALQKAASSPRQGGVDGGPLRMRW